MFCCLNGIIMLEGNFYSAGNCYKTRELCVTCWVLSLFWFISIFKVRDINDSKKFI